MQKGISTLVGIVVIIVIAVVAFGGVFAYQYFIAQTQPVVQTQQNQNTENKASIIEGISIEKPNLVVKGQNLSRVQIYFVPTGTGIDPETMSRIENAVKQSENNGEQIWTYRYPSDLLITNIFAKGFDDKGNLIREVDLPIVGASALADALYGNITDQTAGWKTYTNTQYGFSIQYPSDWKIQEYKDSKNIIRTLAIDPVSVYTQSQYNSLDAPAGMVTFGFNYDYKGPGGLDDNFFSNDYQKVSQVNIGENNSISAIKIFVPDAGAAGTPNPFWRTKKVTTYSIGQKQMTYIDGFNGEKIAYRIYPLIIRYYTAISDTKYDQTVNEILGTLKITK